VADLQDRIAGTSVDSGATPACLKRAFNLAIAAGRLAQKPTFPPIAVHNTRTGFFEEAPDYD
jgi:hypothetical protein